jgi:hypothetical protein
MTNLRQTARKAFSFLGRSGQENDLAERWQTIKGEFPETPESSDADVLIWRGPAAITASLSIEIILVAALRQRGVNVNILACDDVVPGTIRRDVTDKISALEWTESAREDAGRGRQVADQAGISLKWARDWVSRDERLQLRTVAREADLNDIPRVTYDGLHIGRHAMDSMHRYLRGRPLDLTEEDRAAVLREYLFSALVCGRLARNVFSERNPNRLFMQHGFYVEWGPAYEAAMQENIPVVRWGRGYDKDQLRMSLSGREHQQYVHHASDAHWRNVRETSLSTSQQTDINSVLKERRNNPHQMYSGAGTDLLGKLRDEQRPVWGLFAHLAWDAAIFIEKNAFETVEAWVLRSIDKMEQIENAQWVVKVHPAEAMTETQCGVWEAIQDQYSKLPDHVTVLSPETEVNTYDLIDVLDGGITIRGTVGLEMVCKGLPVILAGEAHYGEKGFTLGAKTEDAYHDYLERVHEIESLRPGQVKRAKRYAYDYFINRQLPFEPVNEKGKQLSFSSFDELRPGHFEMLDRICEGIVDGKDFTRGLFEE